MHTISNYIYILLGYLYLKDMSKPSKFNINTKVYLSLQNGVL